MRYLNPLGVSRRLSYTTLVTRFAQSMAVTLLDVLLDAVMWFLFANSY